MDLIDRQALLKQIDIDSDGEPGYYGDTWKFIDTIKSMPSATDKNVGTKLGTDLAQLGTDMIFRWQAIDALCHVDEYNGRSIEAIRQLPPAELSTNLVSLGTDCISRQAAIDIVDGWFKRIGLNGDICLDGLRQLPSAEPKIIRCKDCKNWDTTWTNDFSPNYHYCPMVDGVRKEDWFCADADRREDG